MQHTFVLASWHASLQRRREYIWSMSGFSGSFFLSPLSAFFSPPAAKVWILNSHASAHEMLNNKRKILTSWSWSFERFCVGLFCVSLACGRNFEDGRWQHSDWKQWRQDNRCWQKHVHHTFGLPKYPITSQFTPCNFSESYTLRANTIVCAWSFLFLFRAPSGFPEKMRWPFVCQEQSKTPQACTQNIAGHDEFGLLKRHVHLSRTSLYTKHADN